MFRILKSDGSKEEVPNAATATVDGDFLLCHDRKGTIVASFDRKQVVAYGSGDALENHTHQPAAMSERA